MIRGWIRLHPARPQRYPSLPTREQLDRHEAIVNALYDLAAEFPERRGYIRDMILFAEVNPGRWDLDWDYVKRTREYVTTPWGAA